MIFNIPKIKLQIEGYAKELPTITRETLKEFGHDYAEPLLRKYLAEYRYTGTLEEGVYSRVIRKTDTTFQLLISSNAKDAKGKPYFFILDTGKPKRDEPFNRLLDWVKTKITNNPQKAKRLTRIIQEKIAREGSRPKNFYSVFEKELQELANSVYPRMIKNALRRGRRRYGRRS